MEEIKNTNESTVPYSRLDNEIKKEEESRKIDNIENFKKSQKPKKKLRNKIIAWILGGTIFAGAATGAGFLIHDKVNGDGAYNDAIRTRYEQVDEKLTGRLISDTKYQFLQTGEVTHVRFLEPEEETAGLQVFYAGVRKDDNFISDRTGYAIYNVLIEYYNALVEAESSGNVLHYLDALDTIFTEMQLVDNYERDKMISDFFYFADKTEDNVKKFNEVFALNDVENEDIVRQVGFLPYNIELVSYQMDDTTYTHYYTFKISGISYCETKSESSDEIKGHKDLVLEKGYNKNHIKTYTRDILFTSSLVNEVGYAGESRVVGDFSLITKGKNSPYTVETTHFKEVDLLNIYEDVKDGNFDYKKPKNFNVKDYVKNM